MCFCSIWHSINSSSFVISIPSHTTFPMRMGTPAYRKVTIFSQITKSHCSHVAETHPNPSSSVKMCHTHVNISYCSKKRNCSICPWEMKVRTPGRGTVACGRWCGEADPWCLWVPVLHHYTSIPPPLSDPPPRMLLSIIPPYLGPEPTSSVLSSPHFSP